MCMNKMSKILGVQFRKRTITAAMEQASIRREVGPTVDISFVSILDNSIEWSNVKRLLGTHQGVILGGSGDFDFDGGRCMSDPAKAMSESFLETLKPLLEEVFAQDFPMFGICYGHQLIGRFAGVSVVRDCTQEKSGSHPVSVVAENKKELIFEGIPNTFIAHYGHKDVLATIPQSAILIARGEEKCHISALRYQQHIYTTQFHPEINYQDMFDRVAATPGYLPDGVKVEDVFIDDSTSNRMLRNFAEIVLKKAKSE